MRGAAVLSCSAARLPRVCGVSLLLLRLLTAVWLLCCCCCLAPLRVTGVPIQCNFDYLCLGEGDPIAVLTSAHSKHNSQRRRTAQQHSTAQHTTPHHTTAQHKAREGKLPLLSVGLPVLPCPFLICSAVFRPVRMQCTHSTCRLQWRRRAGWASRHCNSSPPSTTWPSSTARGVMRSRSALTWSTRSPLPCSDAAAWR